MKFKKVILISIAVFAIVFIGLKLNSQPAAFPSNRLSQIISEKKINLDKIFIHIIKSKYRLEIKSDSQILKSYPCVFGANHAGDKMCEGDKKTPVGKFSIQEKKSHPKWNKFMLVSYPTTESWQKFNERKQKHLILNDATIGGAIGIHGVPKFTDFMIDQKINWTLGCISLKNKDVEEVYQSVKVGTVIIIEE